MKLNTLNRGKKLKNLVPDHHDKTKIYHIDIDTKYSDTTGSSLTEGIELLKWLRVKGINNHIVLTSFLPIIYWLKKDPKNAIIGSKGTTFVQLPNEKLINDNVYDFKKDQNGKEITPEPADPEDLKAMFRIEFDLKKIRHEEANYYGLKSLLKIHKTYTNEIKDEVWEVLNNFTIEDMIYDYVYSTKEGNLNTNGLKDSLQNLRDRRFLTQYAPNGKINPDIPRIIYIDDKADNGWADFLRLLVYGNKNPNEDFFKVINIAKNETADTLFEKIKSNFFFKDNNNNNLYPSLVICDLKLLDNESNLNSYEEYISVISFKKLLRGTEEIKQPYKIKWMFFTASNNMSLFRNLTKREADKPHAIFIKEGADLMYNNTQKRTNYLNLINSLHVFFIQKPKNQKTRDEKLIEETVFDTLLLESKINDLLGLNTTTSYPFLDKFDKFVIDTNFFQEFSNRNLSSDILLNVLKILIRYKDKVLLDFSVYEELKEKYEREKKDKDESDMSPVAYISDWFIGYINKIGLPIYEGKKDEYLECKPEMKGDIADKILIEIINEIKENKKVLLLSFDRKDKASEHGYTGPAYYFDVEHKSDNVKVIPERKSFKDFLNFIKTGNHTNNVVQNHNRNSQSRKNLTDKKDYFSRQSIKVEQYNLDQNNSTSQNPKTTLITDKQIPRIVDVFIKMDKSCILLLSDGKKVLFNYNDSTLFNDKTDKNQGVNLIGLKCPSNCLNQNSNKYEILIEEFEKTHENSMNL